MITFDVAVTVQYSGTLGTTAKDASGSVTCCSHSVYAGDETHSMSHFPSNFWGSIQPDCDQGMQSFLKNMFLPSVSLSDTMFVWKCPVSAVPMLPQWKQLHHHKADLCVLLTPRCERCLRDVNTRNGRAAEKGRVTSLLMCLVEQMSQIIVNDIPKEWV